MRTLTENLYPELMNTPMTKTVPKILIIYTGGTVGMIYDERLGTLRQLEFAEIKDNLPEIYRLGYHFYIYPFAPAMDSSDMTPEVWVALAEIIEENYQYYDGFVILHGTDTMSYTASALSFMLENLAKPVVLTGSQLPIGKIRTDARENIITAIEIAAARNARGEAIVPEVCVYFDFRLFRGNRSRKYNAERFEAFYSMNYAHLAEAGVAIRFRSEFILPHPAGPFRVHKKLDPAIAVLKLYPGIPEATVKAVMNTPGARGVVLESFGNGNASTAPWFIGELARAIDRGVVVLNITQCDGGSVELGRYQTSKYLQEIGVTSGFDMTFEAAVTKMMFLFAEHTDPETVARLLQEPLRGELTRP